MRKFPGLKFNRLLRIVTSNPLNFKIIKRKGKSLTLENANGKKIQMCWSSSVDIPGKIVKIFLLEEIGLTEEEAWKLIH